MILNINIVVILKFNIRQKFCVAHMQPPQKKKRKIPKLVIYKQFNMETEKIQMNKAAADKKKINAL